jgi:hypothetical protein
MKRGDWLELIMLVLMLAAIFVLTFAIVLGLGAVLFDRLR